MKNRFLYALLSPVITASLLYPGLLPVASAIDREAAAGTHDFGDAPDGRKTFYPATAAQTGSFPSLLASDGARTQNTSIIWLGDSVDRETDSEQIDLDQFDDGLSLSLKSCETSKAFFVVHLANPGETSGSAFLNLFIDWNRDGAWEGTNDPCGAPDWVLRNVEIDLSEQTTATKVYTVEFEGGQNTRGLWTRGMVTLNERVMDEHATGEYEKGEVEDYGPAKKTTGGVGAYCVPKNTVIKHGEAKVLKVVKTFGSPAFASANLRVGPNYDTGRRKITKIGPDTFLYKSKKVDVHPPEQEIVRIKVRWADGKQVIVKCNVVVIHKKIKNVNQQQHNYTLTSFSGQANMYRSGSNQLLFTDFTPNQAGGELLINDFELPLGEQGVDFPLPSDVDININGQGWPADWTCELVETVRQFLKMCQGVDTVLEADHTTYFDVLFAELFGTPGQLHLHVTRDGEVVGAIDIPLTQNY